MPNALLRPSALSNRAFADYPADYELHATFMTKSPAPDSFEYKGWLVHLELTKVGDTVAGRADLHCDGHYRCRLVLAKPDCVWDRARLALELKAKAFIDERTSDTLSDQTGFTDLGSC